MMAPEVSPHRRSLRALDALAFLLADVQTGVGPFLAVYLSASRHWRPAQIGLVMSAASIAGTLAQAPAGWLIDQARHKREWIALGALTGAVSCVGLVATHSLGGVLALQLVQGIVGAFIPPALAGMTLGIVGPAALDRRIGRNETFNHAGNALAAAVAGGLGYALSQKAIFLFVAGLSVLAFTAALEIQAADVDFERSRGGSPASGQTRMKSLRSLFEDRRLLWFMVSVVLFHFANAAMLPLIGQRLAAGHAPESSLYMAVCIIGAQAVMSVVAGRSGIAARLHGRKPVFLAGFLVLPLRGLLFTLWSNPYYLIAVQLLDGIGAAIFGVVSVLISADLTEGTGRFNFVQGVVGAAAGVGAALSTLLAEPLAQEAGFDAAFLFLAAVAGLGLILFWQRMPETQKSGDIDCSRSAGGERPPFGG